MNSFVLKNLALAYSLSFIFLSANLSAQDELQVALTYEPVQKGVDYTVPTKGEVKNCKIVKASKIRKSGFVVLDENGQVLRMFINNGGDPPVDQWSYYKDGIEVYRDIDTNFDGKADQFRWFGAAGTRWGKDTNGDNIIDKWLQISPEEVTIEIVNAIRRRSKQAYAALLLSEKEIDELGVSKEIADRLKKRTKAALNNFSKMVADQKLISRSSKWVHFGGVLPSLIPKGTNGFTKDVRIYENIAAVVENDGKHGQISVGTLVKVGNVWKSVDLPQVIDDKSTVVASSVFLAADDRFMNTGTTAAASTPRNSEQQKLFEQLEDLEKSFNAAVRAGEKKTINKLNDKRADLLIEIASSYSDADQKSTWVRQFADTVAGAYQSGDFPDGLKRVTDYYVTLKKEKASRKDLGYLLYRMISARYSKKFENARQSEVGKIQKEYLDELEKFVDVYPDIDQAADAMMQLALWNEFSSTTDTEKSEKWYGKIVKTFPNNPAAKKARGALIRLQSEGRAIKFVGPRIDGNRKYSLGDDRGNVVVLHYWQTNPDADYEELDRIYRKFRRKGFNLVNINLDADSTAAKAAIRKSKLPGVHLFEAGGTDSPVSTQLGIAVIPTIILVDQKGKVVNRNIRVSDLEKSVDKLLK